MRKFNHHPAPGGQGQCAAMSSDTVLEIRAQLIKAHQWSRAGEKGHHLDDLQSQAPQVGVALIATAIMSLVLG